jgi:predicted AAA+ superfamily ATPase
MFNRLQQLQGRNKESCFLWGARQTGKSTLLRRLFPDAPYYDMLRSDEFERFSRRPALLREELLARPPKSPYVVG